MAKITRRLFAQALIGAALAFGFLGQHELEAKQSDNIIPTPDANLCTHVQVTDGEGNVEWIANQDFFTDDITRQIRLEAAVAEDKKRREPLERAKWEAFLTEHPEYGRR